MLRETSPQNFQQSAQHLGKAGAVRVHDQVTERPRRKALAIISVMPARSTVLNAWPQA
jgi:hypothetical protein